LDTESIAIVLNPAAGGGRTVKALPVINNTLMALGRPFNIHVTTSGDDAREAAGRFASGGSSRIIAVGGDGTINDVVNGLLDSEARPAFGVLAIGSGSDFARTIQTPKDVAAAVTRCCTYEPRPIDVGWIRFDDGRSRAFLNVAGLGFDAIVAAQAQHTKLPGSNLPYVAAALRTLVSFTNIEVRLDVDGERIETKAVFVQVANGKFMGGGFQIAPMAELSDGVLDLALVGDIGKLDLLRNLPRVYGGSHVTHPKFTHLRAKQVRVETARPALVQGDGEIFGESPVTFVVEPAALRLAG
jgi:YegS/Rv2252/BmrU family lipid kinase